MPSTARLYAPAHIGVASILGSPIAGGLLLFLNERRLGRPGAAVRMLLVGVLLAAATFTAAWLIPSPVGRITPALGALVMVAIARSGRAALAEHLRAGGPLASGWRAAGIGLGCLGVIVAVVLGGSLFFGSKVGYGGGQWVIYEDGATEAEARAVGDVLRAERWFDDSGVRVVSIGRDGPGPGYVLSFQLFDDAWDRPDILQRIAALRPAIAARALPGKPLVVKLCDGGWTPRRTLP